jgi:hypothetical protein
VTSVLLIQIYIIIIRQYFQNQKRSIFESRNPFNGPVVQAPDMWRQIQQRNLPQLQGPNIFPPQP